MSESKIQTFAGTVEWAPQFREPVQRIEVEVDYYRLTDSGELNFMAVRYEGKQLPLQQVSESSLIQAYARHRGIYL